MNEKIKSDISLKSLIKPSLENLIIFSLMFNGKSDSLYRLYPYCIGIFIKHIYDITYGKIASG